MAAHQALDAVGDRFVAGTESARGAGDGHHTDRHAIAVSEFELLACLDGMPDAVTEVQELALACLALVIDDHSALDIDIARDEHGHAADVLLEELGRERRRLELPKEALVGDDAVFDDLAASIGELLVRKGREAAHIGHDRARLPECSGEILARGKVDGGLAAHG